MPETKLKNLSKNLHRTFKTLEGCIPSLRMSINQEETHVKELCNLCEQYKSCQSASIEQLNLPLSLANVKTKILHLILSQINDKLEELCSVLSAHQKLLNKIHESKVQCFQNVPSTNQLVQENQTFPSFALILEWLDDFEKETFNQICLKNELFNTSNFQDENIWQKYLNVWLKEDKKIVEKLQEHIAYLHHFLTQPNNLNV